MSRTTQLVKTRGTVTIDVETCKGCELCIPACPPKVLKMSTAVNRKGYRYPELHPGCTGCAACLMVCPDFCFEVFRYHTPIEIEVEEVSS
jgi:2-oxoglutarate ferredoxin oxidoreductase subunit delta